VTTEAARITKPDKLKRADESPESGPTLFCSIEGADFPIGDFDLDPRWGWVHRTDSGPHTVKGTPVAGVTGGGVVDPMIARVPVE
jgi:hypothetical protein